MKLRNWSCGTVDFQNYLEFTVDHIQLFRERLFTNREKLTWQCQKLLWAIVIFMVAWLNLMVFQHGGRKQHKYVYSCFLLPSCSVTLNLNQAKPNSYYPWYQSALSHMPSHFCTLFCGATFVAETAVFISYPYLQK